MIVDFGALIVLFVIALIFYKGNAAPIVEWLNTRPRYEREQIDMVKLSTFIGKILFVACGCIVLFIIGEWADLFYITTAGAVILIGIAIFGYFYTHTGDRFKKK